MSFEPVSSYAAVWQFILVVYVVAVHPTLPTRFGGKDRQ
jgi:hypothetical protein